MANTYDCPTPDSDYIIAASYDFGGVELRIRYRWWERLAGWYATVTSADALTTYAAHVRLCGGSTILPDETLPGLPSGRLYVIAAVDLDQHWQLGVTQLVFLTTEELAARAA